MSKVLYPHKIDQRRETPVNKLFRNIVFNYNSSYNEDQPVDFYSKRKLQLIRDFNEAQRKKEDYEFKREELQRRTKEQELVNLRLNNIQRGFSPSQTKFYEYNKRYEPKTVFDEKKIIYNKAQETGNSLYPYSNNYYQNKNF